jgi:hypothetical protein
MTPQELRPILTQGLSDHIFQPRWVRPTGTTVMEGAFPGCLCGWLDTTTRHVDRSSWMKHWVDSVLGEES